VRRRWPKLTARNWKFEEKMSDKDVSVVIQKDFWVKLQYRVMDTTGVDVEDGQRQLSYLHGGYGMLFPKLEGLLEGKVVGDKIVAQLEPEDHFGDYDAELVHLVSRDTLPETIEEGMTFEGIPGQDNDGEIYTITDIAEGKVVIDGNHPLAGMALRFDIAVLEVRKATEEEVARELLMIEEMDDFDTTRTEVPSATLH
jgi:FKBP-type peptidyl-prolyl cis-trans isomerase SlyD